VSYLGKQAYLLRLNLLMGTPVLYTSLNSCGYAMSETGECQPDDGDYDGSNRSKDDDKVEIVVSVSLRQRNEERVVGKTSVSVDKDVLGNKPVNVTMNLSGSPSNK